ncbi:gephyrin-like molybdotransferase receptor GlpR [Nocardia sp. NPDC057440]|uniref:divisome protein SepX/GlpR n=1 Tax=Nocardia sp. NPDC057440 TaxID=3346134 RepID=UPI00366B097B
MPNSILWIGLVILWVFVLFPILADRHPRIRQTTDAALATRVLHRGDSKRRPKSGPAAGHDSDPDYRPTRVQRKHSHSDDAEDRMTTPADEPVTEIDNEQPLGDETLELEGGTPRDSRSAAYDSDIADAEIDELDDELDDGENELGGAEAEFDDAEPESEGDDGEFHTESGSIDIAAAGIAANAGAAADDDLVADERTDPAARIPLAHSAAPAQYTDEDTDEDAEFDSADPDFVPTRRGRGGFDPEADAIARAARYTFRQRAVLGLVLSAIMFGALGVAVTSLFWWACGLSAVVLVTYLAYLRKQVRMEEEIRRRRAARLGRGRERAEHLPHHTEKQTRQQAMDRDTARALRRRSARLEADDEDPMFEHLETFDAATARAVRHRTGDMRRAAGA